MDFVLRFSVTKIIIQMGGGRYDIVPITMANTRQTMQIGCDVIAIVTHNSLNLLPVGVCNNYV